MSRNPMDDRGASSVEYGLIVVAIAAVIALIVFSLGITTLGLFSDTCDNMSDAVSQSQGGASASC